MRYMKKRVYQTFFQFILNFNTHDYITQSYNSTIYLNPFKNNLIFFLREKQWGSFHNVLLMVNYSYSCHDNIAISMLPASLWSATCYP